MRIDELKLIAYGHFSDTTIDLSGGNCGLHIIYGSNETGKSTTLRAITNLLYGFKNRTQDAFRFPMNALRVGGTFVDQSGNQISCVRRKSRSNSLSDIDGEPIDDSCITQMLRGVNRESFLDRFGITHQALVDGGQLMIHGGGDVGKSLFAAGAGIRQLLEIQAGIERDCGELFKRNGTRSTLNQLMIELRAKRAELKASILPVKDFKNLQQQVEHKEAQAKTFRNAITETRARLQRVKALQEAKPLLAQIHQIDQSLEQLSDVPLLSEDFSTRQQRCTTEWYSGEEKRKLLESRIALSQTELDDLGPLSRILDQSEVIESLNQSVGGIAKANRERPGLVKRRDLTQVQIEERLKSIGHTQPQQHERYQLPEELRIRIGNLASRYQMLSERNTTAIEEHESLLLQNQTLIDQIAESPQRRSPDALATALQQTGDPTALLHDLDASQAVLDREQRGIELQFRKLGKIDCDLSEIGSFAVASQETIRAYADKWEALQQRHRNNLAEKSANSAAIESLQVNIDELRTEYDVPTEQELYDAREHRDTLGKESCELRDAQGQESADAWALAHGRFIAAIVHCDQISDRLRREAERVAARARLEAELNGARRTTKRLTKEADDIAGQRASLSEQWTQVWSDVPLDPMSPQEMLDWHAEHERLLQMLEKRSEAEEAVARQQRRIDGATAQLSKCLHEVGDTEPGNDLLALAQNASAAIQTLRRQAKQAESLAQQQAQLQAALPEAKRKIERSGADLQQWQEQWGQITDRLELSSDSTPLEVNSIIAAYQEIRSLQEKFDSFQSRIVGIDADAEAFNQEVHSIGLPIDDAMEDSCRIVEAWSSALQQARQVQVRQQQIHQQMMDDREELLRLEEARVDCRVRIDQLCREARTEDLSQLSQIHESSLRKRQLLDRRADIQRQLSRLRGDQSEEQFRESASSDSDESLMRELGEAEHQLQELEEDHEVTCRSLGELIQQQKQMDGSSRGAQLQQEIQDLLGSIERHATEYARLITSATLLRQAITRYREQHQGPVLSIASDYFRRLTLGTYQQLQTDNNHRGDPILLAVRSSDGQSVELSGMSEGTADQLYLALRLASLQHEFESGEPIPVIVDDILIQCDQQRSAAAFELLAEFSATTQVIFFTHNESLIDIAKETIPARELFIQRLDASAPAAPTTSTSASHSYAEAALAETEVINSEVESIPDIDNQPSDEPSERLLF